MTRLEALNREVVTMSRYGILSKADYDTYKLLLDAVEALELLVPSTDELRNGWHERELHEPIQVSIDRANAVLTKLKEQDHE